MHIATAAIWVGGASMIQFFGLRVLASGDSNRLAEFAGNVEWVGSRFLTSASLLALLSGLGLVWESDFWGFGDDWIVIGLILFAITFLAGAGFFGPEAGRIQKLIESEGADASRARVTRLLVLTRIDLMILLLLIFDMTVKPSFEDGWTLLGAIAVAAALAALFTLPTLRARPATGWPTPRARRGRHRPRHGRPRRRGPCARPPRRARPPASPSSSPRARGASGVVRHGPQQRRTP